jgi:hypothetical protein
MTGRYQTMTISQITEEIADIEDSIAVLGSKRTPLTSKENVQISQLSFELECLLVELVHKEKTELATA